MQLQCRQRQRSCASAFPCLAERPRDAEQNGASGVAVQCGAVHKIKSLPHRLGASNLWFFGFKKRLSGHGYGRLPTGGHGLVACHCMPSSCGSHKFFWSAKAWTDRILFRSKTRSLVLVECLMVVNPYCDENLCDTWTLGPSANLTVAVGWKQKQRISEGHLEYYVLSVNRASGQCCYHCGSVQRSFWTEAVGNLGMLWFQHVSTTPRRESQPGCGLDAIPRPIIHDIW